MAGPRERPGQYGLADTMALEILVILPQRRRHRMLGKVKKKLSEGDGPTSGSPSVHVLVDAIRRTDSVIPRGGGKRGAAPRPKLKSCPLPTQTQLQSLQFASIANITA